jgi:copper(I)-binding protein
MHKLIVAAALAATLATPAIAADLSVTDAFGRATPGTGPGVAYFTIHGGDTPDRLLHISSPRAPKVEMHTMTMEGNVMRMREIDAIDVPPGSTVKLAPGGMHLMLMGLSTPLKPGETVPMVLTFEHAGDRHIDVPVGALGANKPVAAMPGMGSHAP